LLILIDTKILRDEEFKNQKNCHFQIKQELAATSSGSASAKNEQRDSQDKHDNADINFVQFF
jgi:hypothetical protein